MVRGRLAHVLRRLADRVDGPALVDDGEIDLYDDASVLATEREQVMMWLADLNGRVIELEEQAAFAPRRLAEGELDP